jgi:hypothetical protein
MDVIVWLFDNIEWLYGRGVHFCTRRAMDRLAAHGPRGLAAMQWLYERRERIYASQSWASMFSNDAVKRAAACGNVATLDWLWGITRSSWIFGYCSAWRAAAQGGHVCVLKWLYEHSRSDEIVAVIDVVRGAAAGAHTDALMWALETFHVRSRELLAELIVSKHASVRKLAREYSAESAHMLL